MRLKTKLLKAGATEGGNIRGPAALPAGVLTTYALRPKPVFRLVPYQPIDGASDSRRDMLEDVQTVSWRSDEHFPGRDYS